MTDQEIQDQVIETLKSLIDGWAISVTVNFTDNTSMCYHRLDRKTGRHILNFGLPVIRNIMQYGIRDRCCKNVRGLSAVKAIACHEYAHAVQTEMGWREYGSVHNSDFYRIYWKMLQDEVK